MFNRATLLIKVSRPFVGWAAFLAIFLVGIITSGSGPSYLQVIQAVLITFPFSLFVFGINDINDFKSDMINPRKKDIEGIKLKRKQHATVKPFIIFFAFVMILSSIATMNISNMIGMSIILVFSYIYSAPPVRLKNRPPLDSIANGIIILGIFILGYSYGQNIISIPFDWLIITIGIVGVHAYTTITDYKYDKKVGEKTFSIVFGKRVTAIFAFLTSIPVLIFVELSDITRYMIIVVSSLFLITSIKPSEKIARIVFNIGLIAAHVISIAVMVKVLTIFGIIQV